VIIANLVLEMVAKITKSSLLKNAVQYKKAYGIAIAIASFIFQNLKRLHD
jgi:hypothetical protein